MNTVQETDVKNIIEQFQQAKKEVAKVIVGQKEVVNQLFVGLLANGHVLLEGVPGLGKTLLVKSLSQAMSLDFHRIQFTPDLMPSDIIGMEILEEDRSTGKRFFQFNKGPVFTNMLLADEINRTPPKTQAALLEAMQEKEVTYVGETHALPNPFFLLATQNPLEQSGTYPLPEAQLDRFLLFVKVDYPTDAEELQILASTTGSTQATIESVLGGNEIIEARKLVRDVTISDELLTAINQIVRNSRPQISTLQEVKEFVDWGAGPRAGQSLILAAKANAFLQGRYAITPDDIKAILFPVLRHRIVPNFKGKTEGVSTDQIIETLAKNFLS